MHRYVNMNIEVKYPNNANIESIETHMMLHKGVTMFTMFPHLHKAVLVINKGKTTWQIEKKHLQDEGVEIKKMRVTGIL